MINYYNRNGDPITIEEWGKLFEDKEYKILRQTKLEDGTFISTVWLGIECGVDGSGPLIYETATFVSPDSEEEVEVYKFSSEEAALRHHEHLCAGNTYTDNSKFRSYVPHSLRVKDPSRFHEIIWEIEYGEDNDR